MENKDFEKLEKRIVDTISNIQAGLLQPSESGIESDLNLMKRLNISSYKNLKDEYWDVINDIKNF